MAALNHKNISAPTPRIPWPNDTAANLVLLACLVVLFFLPVFLHPNRMFWGNDIVRAHSEYKEIQWRSFWKWGTFPLWDPTEYCGKSIVGDPLPALLYPGAFLFWLIPAPNLFGFFLCFQVALGACGMFLFARRNGCDAMGAFLAGVVFALSGKTGAHVFAGHVELLSTMLGLPWILWGVKGVLERPGVRSSLIVGVTVALCAFGGSVQMLYWHGLFVGFYILLWAMGAWFEEETEGVSVRLVYLALGGCFALLLAAPWWFPVVRQTLILGARARGTDFVFSSQGSASFYDLLRFVWPRWELPTPRVLVPDAVNGFFWETTGYSGIVTLCLAAAALVVSAQISGVATLAALLVLSVMLALGENSPFFYLAHRTIPGFALFRCPGRMFFYTNFVLALLAGLMLTHGWRTEKRWWMGVICTLAFESMLVGAVFLSRSSIEPVRGLWVPVLITAVMTPVAFLWSSGTLREHAWRVILLGLLICDLYLFWRPLINVVEPRSAFPRISIAEFLASQREKEEFRVYDPTGLIEQQTAAHYGLELITGYHPGIYARHLDLYRRIWTHDASDINQQFMHSPLDVQCAGILDMMNTKYVVAYESDLGTDYERVFETPPGELSRTHYVFRRKNALPRAWMVARAVTPPAGTSVLDAICGLKPREDCLVDGRPVNGKAGYQELAVERCSPGNIVMRFKTDSSGVAVISQSWHPDWAATDCGKPVEVRCVNHNLVGVPVKAGEHDVHIWYQPWDFYLGLAVAVLMWIVVAATGGHALWRYRASGARP